MSGAQIDKLGKRVRDGGEISESDLSQLQSLLLAHDEVLQTVGERLREIGLAPTTRLKTSGTITDKLRREGITLRSIHDLAGARIVKRMSLDDQDVIRDKILAIWPGVTPIDRRVTPNHGYRAVHLVPKVDGCYVEIQLRTFYQDTWAQLMETFGDMWGREIRYGGLPEEPDLSFSEDMTRREVVELWLGTSSDIAELENLENRWARETDEDRREIEEQIESAFGGLRGALRSIRETLKLPGQ